MANLPETAGERIRREMLALKPVSLGFGSAVEKLLAGEYLSDQVYRRAAGIDDGLRNALGLSSEGGTLSALAGSGSVNSALSDAMMGSIADLQNPVARAMKIANVGATVSGGGVSAARVVNNQDQIKSVADLAPLVRKARKGMKMNQQAFADAAGVGRRFLSELENGKPSLEFDKVLACALAAGIDILAKPRRQF